MPEPGAAPNPKASWLWLWGFLCFAVLALMGSCRQQPFFYPPGSSSQSSIAGPAAVLPFIELLVPDPLSAVDPNTPVLTPAPLSVEKTEKGNLIVAQLAAPSNHLGNADGKALARAFAQELGEAGLFKSVNTLDSPFGLQDEGFIIRGKVLEAALEAAGGEEQYRLAVELSASRPAWGTVPEQRFWHDTFRVAAPASGGSDITEIGALVRRLNQDAAAELKEKLQREIASPSQGAADDASDAPPAAE